MANIKKGEDSRKCRNEEVKSGQKELDILAVNQKWTNEGIAFCCHKSHEISLWSDISMASTWVLSTLLYGAILQKHTEMGLHVYPKQVY